METAEGVIKNVTDEEISLTAVLIKIELQAKAEKACALLNYVTDEMKVESNNAGQLLFDIHQNIKSELQFEIFENIKSLFQWAGHLETTFTYAEEQWNIQQLNDAYWEEENRQALKEKQFFEKLESDKTKVALSLETYFSVLSNITNYEQLLKLDTNVIELLIKFESCVVDALEANNECIDGHTSGHHADKLYVFKEALQRETFSGGYVYFDDDGEFAFDLVRDIQAALKYSSTTAH